MKWSQKMESAETMSSMKKSLKFEIVEKDASTNTFKCCYGDKP